jgi:hypothetical protein
MRFLIIFISLVIVVSLASCSAGNPVEPGKTLSYRPGKPGLKNHNRWFWGNWMMYVPEGHSSIEVTHARTADKHHNVKMLLEKSPCDNCLWISKFANNGDGTISVDITIRHPYPANRYYTGFDVRGIFYVPAHYFFKDPDPFGTLTGPHFPALEKGDPEVLNADGYTNAFSPFMPNQHLYPPILKYQPGGDLGGTYDEDDKEYEGNDELFPFKCYYSSEVRRHFATNEKVTRTYHIALPPGSWEFGYSVDACWAEPINVPVIDIETDFPVQANTLMNYEVEMVSSGPIIGSEPSTIVVKIYHHIPDVFEDYKLDDVIFYSKLIADHQKAGPDEGPIIIGNEYVEYSYDLYNETALPPGKYPLLAHCWLTSQYIADLDPKAGVNALFHQILWVTVES